MKNHFALYHSLILLNIMLLMSYYVVFLECLRYYLRKKTKLEGNDLEIEIAKGNGYITEDIGKTIQAYKLIKR